MREYKRPRVTASFEDVAGELIRYYRQEKGMTQSELATEVGVARTTLINLERGVRTLKLNEVVVFADVLGVNVSDLIPVEDNE